MLGYKTLIVEASLKNQGDGWMGNNQQFLQRAANKTLHFSNGEFECNSSNYLDDSTKQKLHCYSDTHKGFYYPRESRSTYPKAKPCLDSKL